MYKILQGLLLSAVPLLMATSCVTKRPAVVMDHDARSPQDSITYCGKPLSTKDLLALGEKPGSEKIDLLVKKDGRTEKQNFKKWCDGMKRLPELILSMPGDMMN